jgi:hypothetical protein
LIPGLNLQGRENKIYLSAGITKNYDWLPGFFDCDNLFTSAPGFSGMLSGLPLIFQLPWVQPRILFSISVWRQFHFFKLASCERICAIFLLSAAFAILTDRS